MNARTAQEYDAAQPDPRKPGRPIQDGEAATHHIHLRTTAARKNAYVRAARGKLSAWIFAQLDRAAGYDPK